MSSTDAILDLITRDLEGTSNLDHLKAVLAEGRTLRGFWNVPPIGKPNIGLLLSLSKIADFLQAGVHFTILLSDVHASLENQKLPKEQILARAQHFQNLILSILHAFPVNTTNLEFKLGSSFQLSRDYTLDTFKLYATTREDEARAAEAEGSGAGLYDLLWPGLQALDEEYLKADFQFGSIDQKRVFEFAEHRLPRLGYAARTHLMAPVSPSFSSAKPAPAAATTVPDDSSTTTAPTQAAPAPSTVPATDGGIEILDPASAIKKKIKSAFCEEGNITNNGILNFVGKVLLPISRTRLLSSDPSNPSSSTPSPTAAIAISYTTTDAPPGTLFSIPRRDLSTLHYTSFPPLQADFESKSIHPGDLKAIVTTIVTNLLAVVQSEYEGKPEWKEVEAKAYPSEKSKKGAKPPKKEKVKDKVRGKPQAESADQTADQPTTSNPASASATATAPEAS